jgi:hypothetical protein
VADNRIWTPEDIARWKRDFFAWVEESEAKIWTPRGVVPFTPWNYQRRYISLIQDKHFVIVLKTRQLGLSTITAAFVAWGLAFYPDFKVGVISKKGSDASEFINKIRTTLDGYILDPRLPKHLRPKKIADNARSLVLDIGSRVESAAATADALRSRTYHLIIIDEAAFAKYIEQFAAASLPTITPSIYALQEANPMGYPWGIVIISTPNGKVGTGKWFYERWMEAVNGKSVYTPFRIHYSEVEELGEEWAQLMKDVLIEPERIRQEMELDFDASHDTFLEYDTLRQIQIAPEPYTFTVEGQLITSVLAPQDLGDLVLGVDVATGMAANDNADYTAIEGIDLETGYEMIAWKGRLPRLAMREFLYALVKTLPVKLVCIERNSIGIELILDMMGYPSVPLYYYRDGHAGFPTTIATRPYLLSLLRQTITEDPACVRLPNLVEELRAFKGGTKPQAEQGEHDDAVLAFALALKAREEYLEKGALILDKRAKNLIVPRVKPKQQEPNPIIKQIVLQARGVFPYESLIAGIEQRELDRITEGK